MKRRVALLLCLCLCIGLCACGEDKKPSKITVELTNTNYDDYFYVEVETRNYEKKTGNLLGTYWESATADCYVTIAPKVPLEASNVSMSFTISGGGYFWCDGNDIISLNVPATGSTSKSLTIEADAYVPGILVKPEFTLLFAEVSGTITIEGS